MKSGIRTKVTAAVLAGVLLGGGAAACSDSGSGDGGGGKGRAGSGGGQGGATEVSPAAAVKKAVDNNEDITSLSFTMKGKAPGADGGEFSGEASMDVKSEAMQMTMTGGNPPEDIEIRVVDKVMYLKGGEPVDGKSWLKFDMTKAEEGDGVTSATTDQNPIDSSSFMTASKDLKKVGEETIDGVQTTHYTGTVTLADLRKSLDGDAEAKKRREKTLDAYDKLGMDKLTMDMWIDKDDHTKQVRVQGTTKEGPLDTTITFGELNKPVEVKAPPASEVMDLAKMMDAQS
ncbi:LppX_LprAFG lipoprotein [Streptomyces sp. NPDC051940]|uniref:LppX_LprAFG lipoprotein n=1 Tax=Streptomyces sp. NPDC051940 TaxID=3155675 RepID=UPI00341329DE